MDVMNDWAAGTGGGMPVFIGEWGVGWGSRHGEMDCNNIRLWYETFHHDIATLKKQPTMVWDDGGWFGIFDHASDDFANNLVDCIDGACEWTGDQRLNAACN
jgi:endoglucanase